MLLPLSRTRGRQRHYGLLSLPDERRGFYVRGAAGYLGGQQRHDRRFDCKQWDRALLQRDILQWGCFWPNAGLDLQWSERRRNERQYDGRWELQRRQYDRWWVDLRWKRSLGLYLGGSMLGGELLRHLESLRAPAG